MNKLNKIYSLFERVCNVNGQLLTESQESKSQSEAIEYVMDIKKWSREEANNFVRVDLRNDITSLRDRKIAKFTLGVTRMYCNGELNSAKTINDLNVTLKLLSAHLNEYDRNLNGLSASELIERFAQVRQDNVDAEKGEIDSMDFSGGSNYKIVPINSFEEAKPYYEYTNPNSRWCLTYMNNMYESYTCNGMNQIYFCLKNGFESIKPIVGENAPLDEYGLSMLSIIVNERGELAYCTTRWNHGNGGSDQSMSAKEVSQVVGVNFYQVFKPNNKWNDLIAEVKERLSSGEDPNDIFDWVYDFSEGFARVKLNKKWNFLTKDYQLLSNPWYDFTDDFYEGFSRVYIEGKGWNFINTDGQLLSNQWFDGVDYFSEGFARVYINGKGWNFLNTEGQLLTNQWYDNVDIFKNGFAKVEIKGKGWNFINTDGQLLTNQWFDLVGKFFEGFASVKIKGKGYNYINTEGQLLNNQLYDNVSYFSEGFGIVELEDKGWNFINTKGQYLTNQWFDYVENFNDGFASIKIEGEWKKIDRNGKIY